MSDRIDCATAPDGFMKSFVSSASAELFYWDKTYLAEFIERKNSVVPGHHYFSKVERFSKNHAQTGEKYLEIVKFACEFNDGSCSHCLKTSWIDAVCHRIPEPMPAYTNRYKNLHMKDTPSEIDGAPRPVNEFNPRIQLKHLFQQGTVKNEDLSTITSFAEKYIVPESVVKIALDDLIFKQLIKEAKKKNE